MTTAAPRRVLALVAALFAMGIGAGSVLAHASLVTSASAPADRTGGDGPGILIPIMAAPAPVGVVGALVLRRGRSG